MNGSRQGADGAFFIGADVEQMKCAAFVLPLLQFGRRELDDVGHKGGDKSMRPSEFSDGLLLKIEIAERIGRFVFQVGHDGVEQYFFGKLIAVARQQKRVLYRFAADNDDHAAAVFQLLF